MSNQSNDSQKTSQPTPDVAADDEFAALGEEVDTDDTSQEFGAEDVLMTSQVEQAIPLDEQADIVQERSAEDLEE